MQKIIRILKCFVCFSGIKHFASFIIYLTVKFPSANIPPILACFQLRRTLSITATILSQLPWQDRKYATANCRQHYLVVSCRRNYITRSVISTLVPVFLLQQQTNTYIWHKTPTPTYAVQSNNFQ